MKISLYNKEVFNAPVVLAGLMVCSLQLEAQVIEEVIVTATKRPESIQTTSAAVSAFGANQLKLRDLSNVQDLQFSVPGLVYGESVGTPQITIRGIGLSVETGNAEMGVATYVNGVFLSRPGLTNLAFGDLERAEVLRGPQGTLYGRNATGGAINFMSKSPTDEFEVSGAISKETFNTKKIDAVLSGPLISDRLKARLFYSKESSSGYIKDLSPRGGSKKIGSFDADSLRLSLRIDITDNVLMDLRSGLVKKDGKLNPFQVVNYAGIATSSITGEEIFTTKPHNVYNNVDAYADTKGYLNSAKLLWHMGGLTLSSISGYTRHKLEELVDADGRDSFNPVGIPGTDLPGADTDIVVDRKDDYSTFTQEFNLSGILWGRVDYVLGLFYLKERGDLQLYTAFGPSTLTAGTLLIGSRMEEEDTSKAIFTDLKIEITDDIRLLLGARYGIDTIERVQYDDSIAPTLFGYNSDGSCDRAPDIEHENFNPKYGVEYDLSEDLLVYATYQESTKPGGYNVTVCGDFFEEEQVKAYEIGSKLGLLSGRMTANFAAFHYDYRNYQVFQVRPPATAEIVSAPKAEVKGAELELAVAVSAPVQVDIGLSYLDAKYIEFFGDDAIYLAGGPGVQNLKGNKLTRAPDWSANIGMQYATPLFDGELDLTFRAEYAYTGEMYFRQFNTEFDRQKGYAVSNAYLSVSFKEPKIQLRAFIKNINDTAYVVSQVSNSLETIALLPDAQGRQATFLGLYGPPRTVGAELRAEF